jgi:hypothetical protein
MCYREGWQVNDANRTRGEEWLGRIYQQNLAPIWDTFKSQKDFGNVHTLLPALVLTRLCRLDLRKYHLRPLPLRPQHPERRRNRAGCAVGHHDSESASRDEVAYSWVEADWDGEGGGGGGVGVCKSNTLIFFWSWSLLWVVSGADKY